jgi:O-antigen ligase
MTSQTATILCVAGIATLLWLARQPKARVSAAVWIPVTWLFIAASRTCSQWFGLAPATVSADQYVEGSPLDRLVLTGLFIAGMVVLGRRSGRLGALLQKSWPVFILLGYALLAVLWSDFPWVAFKRWIKALGNVVMILVVLTELNPLAAVKRWLGTTAILLIPLSVLFIKYYPELGRGYYAWTWDTFYQGVAIGKNGLGAICMIFGLASLWRVVESLSGKAGRRVAAIVPHLVVLSMTFWLFAKADSSTSLGCFLIGTGLLLIMKLSAIARKTVVTHLVVLGIILVCVYGLIINPGAGLTAAAGKDVTLTGRTELWADILYLARKGEVSSWFGTGFESFWLGDRVRFLWDRYWWQPTEAHNGYLELFVTLGWVGLILQAVVLLWGYRNVITLLRRQPEWGRLVLAYFVVAVVYNLPEAAFRGTHPVWIIFLLTVMAVPVSVAQPGSIVRRGRRATEESSDTPTAISPDVLDSHPAYAGLPAGTRNN